VASRGVSAVAGSLSSVQTMALQTVALVVAAEEETEEEEGHPVAQFPQAEGEVEFLEDHL
jgi:hypothetical protein